MTGRGLPAGVTRKHRRSCPRTGRCRCPYQVQAGPRTARQTRTFATSSAAVAWKRDVDDAKAKGLVGTGRSPTVREASVRWLADAEAGVALARNRRPYRPSTLRDYRRCLEVEIYDELGARRLDAVTRERLNEFVDSLARRGLAASTVRNVVMPLRAVYRHAIARGWTRENPTRGVEVPAGSGRRLRVIEPGIIASYLAALDERDRALWATAIYAGLRRGELMALRWADVDLAGGLIRIDAHQGGYDQKTRTTHGPKSDAGVRRVPVAGGLRELLLEHRARAGARPQGLVFARGALAGHCRKGSERVPFHDSTVARRAQKAWTKAGLPAYSLHECRHTFASLVIAAMSQRGVFNPKLLQAILGHSSIQVTYDRYGHLFPGGEAEVGVMLDELLAGQIAGEVTSDLSTEVAEAWSRLEAAIAKHDPEEVRPVVAQALAGLSSWQQTHADEGPVSSGRQSVQPGVQRAASVQRTVGSRGPA